MPDVEEPEEGKSSPEEEESLLTPWRKMFRTINVMLAGGFGLCLADGIIYCIFWFLEKILKTKFPWWVQSIAMWTTLIALVAYMLRFLYEELTEHGRQLRAKANASYLKAAKRYREDRRVEQAKRDSEQGLPALPFIPTKEENDVQRIQARTERD